MVRLRRWFLTGLATALPLGVTVFVVWFLVRSLGNLLRPLLSRIPGLASLPYALVSLVGFVVLVLLITALGALTTGIVGRRFMHWLDHLMQRLPLAKDLYGSARQLTDAVFVKRTSLRRAVVAEYPGKGLFAVGFLTSDERITLPDGRRAALVFFPTAPNPTTGWLALIPENEVADAGMTIEDALKFVVSGGLVRPPAQSPAPRP
jgi:uncharacterized membrane protein